MADFTGLHLEGKGGNTSIYFIARPFLGHTSGTGEQYVSNIFYASLLKRAQVTIFRDIKIISPYHSWMSIVYYDYIALFIALLTCKVRNIKTAIFVSPYQCIFIWFFRLLKIRTVVMIHDCFFIHHGSKTIFNTYSYFLYRFACRYADQIVTSTRENQILIEKYFLRSATITPLYLDESFSVKYIEKKFQKTFGYIGKYDNFRKRVFYVLDFLRKTSMEVHYIFAGHMREKFQNELFALKNKHISYEILGPIDFSHKIVFYKRINFLFFPTDLEGFGLPILEALRTSVIPIVFEDAEIPKVLKKSCIKIQKVEDIDTILKSFSDNREKYNMTIYENYVYSQKFSENDFLKFFQISL